jgi:hypothetical protein
VKSPGECPGFLRILVAMNRLVAVSFLASICLHACAQSGTPRVFLLNAEQLAVAKSKNDPYLLELAREAGDKALKFEPVSVMDKTQVPPSGDKHDFLSMALYWFPNPNTKDGLPYIRRDGIINHEGDVLDRFNFDHLNRNAHALALAWYLTGDTRYAEHAVLLLRTWYLNPETAMKPNLKFAAYVPGVNSGRDSGVINGTSISLAVDAVGMLQGSPAWSAQDEEKMHRWLEKYYGWLRDSKHGQEESESLTNHGTWYAVQASAISRYLGKDNDAKKIGEDFRDHRISKQIDKHGMQKYEMERTKSFSYSASISKRSRS